MGGICLYDPEAHPAFKDAVTVYQTKKTGQFPT